MSKICNRPPVELPPDAIGLSASKELYERVDRPIATGSAHFMRAGAEFHLMHADLELNDTVQAALRVASARAAIAAAIACYEDSHRLSQELGFYAIHDQRLENAGTGRAGVLGTLRDAQEAGLVDVDERFAQRIDCTYREGGDEAAFTGFIADLKAFAVTLAEFDVVTARTDPEMWARFAWSAITEFDRIRITGQVIAIVNIFGTSRTPSSAAGV